VDEEQYTIGHQTTPTEYLDREEVDSSQDRHVGLNELFPSRILAPYGRWLNAVPSEYVAHRLIGDMIAEIGQRAHDPIVAPAGILPRHPNDQRLQLRLDSWSAGIAPEFFERPPWIKDSATAPDKVADKSNVEEWVW
jgi:hypothetical protein